MNAPFQVNDTVAIAKGRRWASVDELPKDLWQRKELGLLAYKAKAFQEAATIWTEAVQDLKIWSAEDCKSVCGSSELKHLQLMFILGINQAAAIIEIAKLATTSFDRQYAAMVAMLGLALAHSSLEYCPHGFGPPALLVAKLYYREAVVARMRDAFSAAYEAICEAAALSPQDKVIQAEAETIDALFEENGHAGGLGDVLDYFAHMRAAGSWGGIPTVG